MACKYCKNEPIVCKWCGQGVMQFKHHIDAKGEVCIGIGTRTVFKCSECVFEQSVPESKVKDFLTNGQSCRCCEKEVTV